MLTAIRRFLAEGYLFIGLDHFAREGDELAKALADRSLRRNFMGHTTQAGVDLIGFGPSAISELRASYAQSQREVPAWEAAVRERGVATMRGHRLSRADVERRWIINRILCHGELRAREYEETFGRAFAEAYKPELASLEPARARRPDRDRRGRQPARAADRAPARAHRGDGVRRLSARAAEERRAHVQQDGPETSSRRRFHAAQCADADAALVESERVGERVGPVGSVVVQASLHGVTARQETVLWWFRQGCVTLCSIRAELLTHGRASVHAGRAARGPSWTDLRDSATPGRA
jgi:hypothetical protein